MSQGGPAPKTAKLPTDNKDRNDIFSHIRELLTEQNVILRSLNDRQAARDVAQPIPQLHSKSPAAWRPLLRSTRTDIEPTIERWKTRVDALLVFVGLFSAIATALYVESTTRLIPDEAARANELLLHLSTIILSFNGTGFSAKPLPPEPPFRPEQGDLRATMYWAITLAMSVSVAAIAVVCRGYVTSLLATIPGIDPCTHFLEIKARWDAAEKWLEPVLNGIPQILTVSIIFFVLGLVDGLSVVTSRLNSPPPMVLATILCIASFTAVLAFLVYSILHGVFHPKTSPYHSSLSRGIIRSASSLPPDIKSFPKDFKAYIPRQYKIIMQRPVVHAAMEKVQAWNKSGKAAVRAFIQLLLSRFTAKLTEPASQTSSMSWEIIQRSEAASQTSSMSWEIIQGNEAEPNVEDKPVVTEAAQRKARSKEEPLDAASRRTYHEAIRTMYDDEMLEQACSSLDALIQESSQEHPLFTDSDGEVELETFVFLLSREASNRTNRTAAEVLSRFLSRERTSQLDLSMRLKLSDSVLEFTERWVKMDGYVRLWDSPLHGTIAMLLSNPPTGFTNAKLDSRRSPVEMLWNSPWSRSHFDPSNFRSRFHQIEKCRRYTTIIYNLITARFTVEELELDATYAAGGALALDRWEGSDVQIETLLTSLLVIPSDNSSPLVSTLIAKLWSRLFKRDASPTSPADCHIQAMDSLLLQILDNDRPGEFFFEYNFLAARTLLRFIFNHTKDHGCRRGPWERTSLLVTAKCQHGGLEGSYCCDTCLKVPSMGTRRAVFLLHAITHGGTSYPNTSVLDELRVNFAHVRQGLVHLVQLPRATLLPLWDILKTSLLAISLYYDDPPHWNNVEATAFRDKYLALLPYTLELLWQLQEPQYRERIAHLLAECPHNKPLDAAEIESFANLFSSDIWDYWNNLAASQVVLHRLAQRFAPGVPLATKVKLFSALNEFTQIRTDSNRDTDFWLWDTSFRTIRDVSSLLAPENVLRLEEQLDATSPIEMLWNGPWALADSSAVFPSRDAQLRQCSYFSSFIRTLAPTKVSQEQLGLDEAYVVGGALSLVGWTGSEMQYVTLITSLLQLPDCKNLVWDVYTRDMAHGLWSRLTKANTTVMPTLDDRLVAVLARDSGGSYNYFVATMLFHISDKSSLDMLPLFPALARLDAFTNHGSAETEELDQQHKKHFPVIKRCLQSLGKLQPEKWEPHRITYGSQVKTLLSYYEAPTVWDETWQAGLREEYSKFVAILEQLQPPPGLILDTDIASVLDNGDHERLRPATSRWHTATSAVRFALSTSRSGSMGTPG